MKGKTGCISVEHNNPLYNSYLALTPQHIRRGGSLQRTTILVSYQRHNEKGGEVLFIVVTYLEFYYWMFVSPPTLTRIIYNNK